MSDRPLTPQETLQRWKLAIHESAHVVAAWLEGVVATDVCIDVGGGGYTAVEFPCRPFAEALSTAAGPASEYLASRHEPPTLPSTGDVSIPNDGLDAGARRVRDDRRKWMMRVNISLPDEMTVRYWSVEGADPARWGARYHWLKAVADGVVHRNEGRILAVANRLYLDRELDAAAVLALLGEPETRLVDTEVYCGSFQGKNRHRATGTVRKDD